MNVNGKEDLLGKILLAISIVLLGFSIVVAFKFPYLSIDEWFTLGLIKLPIIQQIYITSIDVHPPLYYLIADLGVGLFNALNINLDPIIILELVSIVPYVIILALAVTVMRRDYGWLSCGTFAFTLFAMSEFFTQYLNARMYSWGLLFTVIGFLFIKPILEKNELKYWILLSIFAVLGAYTHYFVAITFIAIYILLFGYVLIMNRAAIKNWFISAVVGVVLYAPWVYILIQQMGKVHDDYWVKALTVNSVMKCLGYLLTSYENFILSAAAVILFFVLFALVFRHWYKNRETDDEFMLIGVTTIVLSVLMAIAISLKFKPILVARYIIPLISIVWVVFSIYITKIEIKRLILPLVLVLMIIGFVNIGIQMEDVYSEHIATQEALDFMEGINNNHTLVIYEGMQKYLRFSDFLNNTKNFTCYKLNNETHEALYVGILNLSNDSFDFKKDFNNYSKYDVYFIKDIDNKLNHTKDFGVHRAHRVGNCVFTYLNPR